ncbi:MAG: hypothetical protein ACOY0S_02550 [Patescibacteria group bacterium]
MDQKALILDIAMNFTRLGNWVADDFPQKRERIDIFLKETDELLNELKVNSLPGELKIAVVSAKKMLQKFQTNQDSVADDPLRWAESLLTWGNILTHRAKLLA